MQRHIVTTMSAAPDPFEIIGALAAFYDDYVTLRRHLIDEGLLSRASGEYWRTGGTVVI